MNNSLVPREDLPGSFVPPEDLPNLVPADDLPDVAGGIDWSGDLRKMGQSALSALPSVAALPSSLVEVATDIVRPVTAPIAGALGTRDPVGILGDIATAERKRLGEQTKALTPDTSGLGNFEAGVVNAPRSVVQTALVIPAVLATKSPAPLLASMGGVSGGEAYAEAKDAGKGLPASLTYGAGQAALEVGTEMLGIPAFMKTLTAKTGLVKAATEFLAKELAGEELATATQDLNTWAVMHPDKPFSAYLAERPSAFMQTLGGVAAGSSMQAGAAAAVNKSLDYAKKKLVQAEELRLAKEELTGGIMGDNANQLPPTGVPQNAGDTIPPPTATDADNPPQNANLPPSNPYADLPTEPLTPAEEQAAAAQLKAEAGNALIPDHPEGVAALSNLSQVLAQGEFSATTEEEIQARAQQILDANPTIGEQKAERRARNEFPNSLPAEQRPIAWSADASEVGLTFRQLPPQKAGTVRVLGANEEQFSPELTAAIGSTVQEWATKFLAPEDKVVVNLSGLAGGVVGAYAQLADGTHVISPEELVRTLRAEEGGQLVGYNQFTQSEMYGALTHEFGHALLASQFTKGLGREYYFLVQQLDNSPALLPPEQLANLPEPVRAVVDDYQARKIAILNRTMTAQELMDNWSGVWKVGRDLMKQQGETKSLYTAGRKALGIVDNEGRQLRGKFGGPLTWADGKPVLPVPFETATALDLVHALGRNTNLTEAESNRQAEAYLLSFNEFMAEQFTRYAHDKKIYQGTALGHYFERMLAALVNFFRVMKAEGKIKAGTAFNTWLDEVVRVRALTKTKKPRKARKPAAVKPVKEKTDAEQIKEAVASNVQHPTPLEELAEDKDRQRTLRKRLTDSLPPVAARTAREKKLAAQALEALKMGNELEFEEIMQELKPAPTPKVFKDVKEKGGAWHAKAWQDLTRGLFARLSRPLLLNYMDGTPDSYDKEVDALWAWNLRLGRNYLNKYAGTKEDPIRQVLVPYHGALTEWENLTDFAIKEVDYATWSLSSNSPSLQAMQDYLAHAADYLLAKVPRAKWENYDLTRLVKETERWDRENEAAAAKASKDAVKQLPVEREYPEGFRWVSIPSANTAEGLQLTMKVGELGAWCTKAEVNAKAYNSGNSSLFALVGPANDVQAQVQVERITDTNDPVIRQMKGKANGPIKAEYQAFVLDFLRNPLPSLATEDGFDYVSDKELAGVVDLQYNADTPKSLRDRVAEHFVGQRFVPESDFYQVLDMLLVAAKADIERSIVEEKGFTVYRGAQLENVLKQVRGMEIGSLNEDLRRIARTQLNALQQSEGGLHFDKKEPAADIEAANESTNALRRIGHTIAESRWPQEAINFVSNAQHWMLQIQQLAHTETNAPLQVFSSTIQKLGAMKNTLMAKAVTLAEQWEHLSPEMADTFERVLKAEYDTGGHATELVQLESGRWQHQTGVGFYDFLKLHGVDGATQTGEQIVQLILDYKNSILEHIDVREAAAVQALKQRFRKSPLVIRQRALQVREAAAKWRNQPYIPQGHFGDYIVKVHGEDTKTGKRGVVHVEHFETAALRDAALVKFQQRFGKDNVRWHDLPDKVAMQMTIPLDFLHTLSDTGEFTEEQLGVIGEALVPIHTDKVFRIFARDAAKISGASPDMLKNYANWIEDSANSAAKFVHGRALTQAIAWARQDVRDARKAGDIAGAARLQRIANTMDRAKQFIMHPKDEFFKTRSTIALTMLLWAPKTALMNLTGLVQTWAEVTADYGDIAGNAEFAKTMKKLASGSVTELDQWAIGRATEEGLIDQGFGHFMAGLANAGNLARKVRKNALGRVQRGFVEYGMLPFTAVEHVNRKMTLVTLFNLEYQRNLKRGLNTSQAREEAFLTASRYTRSLQNDYAAGNRPAAMQGRRSIFMVFLSYPQYMLWIMSGGFERGTRLAAQARGESPRSYFGGMTMRMWLIFLMLAGYEGVPFGEFIQAVLQKFWNTFGGGENLDVEAQKFMKDTLGMRSSYWRNTIQRGLLHNVGGIDLSGSYSMGMPLPGMRLLKAAPTNGRELLGTVGEEVAGPFGGMVSGAAGLLTADSIGYKELGRAIPGEFGTLMRTLDAAQGGPTDAKGARLLRDEQGNPREATKVELAFMAAGFSLAEISEKRFIEAAERQIGQYWDSRRLGLLKDYAEATQKKDRELVQQVNAAIKAYNTEAPFAGLRITGKEQHEYVSGKIHAIQKAEADQVSKRRQGPHQAVGAAFQ